MSERFAIATIAVEGGGRLGISPLPGRCGALASDLDVIADWNPELVVSLTERAEMNEFGAGDLAAGLAARDIDWSHLPIRDLGPPDGAGAASWPRLSRRINAILDDRGGVLLHCRGGKGRSGMILLRLLVERGEAVQHALARLRAARPGAVETDAQMSWARGGAHDRR